jgi:hypothetical protein
MTEGTLVRIQEAIRGESLDGWLFWNFHHRDRLSDELLGLSQETPIRVPGSMRFPDRENVSHRPRH